MQESSSLRQRELLEAMFVDEVPEIGGDVVVVSLDNLDGSITETLQEPRRHRRQDLLSREPIVPISQRAVKPVETPKEGRVFDLGIVDGSANQPLVQDLGPHVEHALAEPGAGGRPS